MLYAGMIIATIAGYVFFCNVSNLDVYLMKPERQHFCVFFFLHIHFTSLKLMSFNVGKNHENYCYYRPVCSIK